VDSGIAMEFLGKKDNRLHLVVVLPFALVAFALSFILLQWTILGAALLSLGCYLGLSFFLTPVSRFSGVEIGDAKNGEEIRELLEEGEKDLASIAAIAEASKDQQIKAKALKVCREGRKIVGYIKKNPRKAIMARRFFNYYLDTANEMLTKYHGLVSLEIETERLGLLREKTLSALDSIARGMVIQFSRLISSDVIDIEADIKLLESAVRMEDS
jgi:5-bromo-4-chloroindolyl phosphate hydrolysis protein